jgi:hypothetical protein
MKKKKMNHEPPEQTRTGTPAAGIIREHGGESRVNSGILKKTPGYLNGCPGF